METNSNEKACSCNNGENIVIACSGACDLGQVTDLIARRLRDNKLYKMNCLAAVGADVQTTIDLFKSSNLLMLDGCPVDCGKKILDKSGITGYKYIRMTDLGYSKGQTPVTSEVLDAVYQVVTN